MQIPNAANVSPLQASAYFASFFIISLLQLSNTYTYIVRFVAYANKMLSAVGKFNISNLLFTNIY
jgi:hypothetical protein